MLTCEEFSATEWKQDTGVKNYSQARGEQPIEIRLARNSEAQALAEMSRELIEQGLTWRWQSPQMLSRIKHPDSVVLVARTRVELVGFAVMEFHDIHAHLNLLAVSSTGRRRRIGTSLLNWLEKSALEAGIGQVVLEVRSNNMGARSFYRENHYEEVEILPGYYQGKENAVRMVHHLIEPEIEKQRP